jgi:hypothetical protein
MKVSGICIPYVRGCFIKTAILLALHIHHLQKSPAAQLQKFPQEAIQITLQK